MNSNLLSETIPGNFNERDAIIQQWRNDNPSKVYHSAAHDGENQFTIYYTEIS